MVMETLGELLGGGGRKEREVGAWAQEREERESRRGQTKYAPYHFGCGAFLTDQQFKTAGCLP